jgi:hypothetical protein
MMDDDMENEQEDTIEDYEVGATPLVPGRSIVPTKTPNMQAFVDGSKDPNVQWRVTTEPNEKNFPDLETLVTVAKSWAAENMFSLFKLRSDKEKVVLACSHGNEYRPAKHGLEACGRRTRDGIKTDCNFRLNGRKQSDGSWNLNLTNLTHNHARPSSLSGIANARRDSNLQREEILCLSAANVRPNQIMQLLDQNNLLTKKDLYNMVAAEKKRKLEDKLPLQYLLDHFRETNTFHQQYTNDAGQLTGLFFAFEEGITLGKRFNTVFLVDATYKTNRFKLPLVHFVGVNCFKKSFSACFMFISKEDELQYHCAMQSFKNCFGINPKVFVTDKEDALRNAISVVFPEATNLLCIWHINKNVLKNCLNKFDTREQFGNFMKEINQLLFSSTETSFNDLLIEFRSKFSNSRGADEYIINNVVPLKKFIVHAWTNSVRHFGNTATSRAEGQHRVIKEYFKSSTGDLLTAVDNLRLSSKNQFREFNATIEKEKITVYRRHDTMFDNVRGKVSSVALGLVQKEISTPHPRRECSGVFHSIYGIICGHTVDNKVAIGAKLEMDDFDSQWWLQVEVFEETPIIESEFIRIRDLATLGGNTANALLLELRGVGSSSNIFDPNIQRTKGRPRGALNQSTRRDPSGFEHVEGAKGRRRCSHCGGVGHNARTCNHNQALLASSPSPSSSSPCL